MDFKSGTEFKVYDSKHLPHIKLLALDAMQEFGESILEDLVAEISRRSDEFKRVNASKLGEYVKATNKPMPKILVIMDEFQILFNDSADNSELMAQINEIVSGYVGVTKTDADEDSKKFDISNIDFDRLRKEFEKAQNKNLMFKDLQDIVEERLLRMMKNNPLRINYYERYQEIVDEYNKENRKDEIAIVFENLMNLVNDLDEEQKRYVREGFDSDEELTMFDLLVKDSLTKEEIKQVKKLAQTMLAKIKARIHELDHWRDKEETQSIISVMIRDLLWAELPESYDDVAIADYRQQIYEYVYNAYPAA